MHEMSLALEVCRIAEMHAAPLAPDAVTSVGVDVGDDSGVELESLRFCLEATLAAPPFRAAVPVVQRCHGRTLRVTYVEVDDERPSD